MQTEILSKTELSKAINCLKEGDPIVFPTETVYGLGAPIFNQSAVKKVFRIKKRPMDNPLIAHIGHLEEAWKLSHHLSGKFSLLATNFWPGPLTIVLPKAPKVPDLVSAGHPTIAIRMPSHPIALELIKTFGDPLVAPSANLSGRPSPTRVEDVLEDLDGAVRYIVDGGECVVGIESTVISLIDDEPVLLRPGKITKEAIEWVLKESIREASHSDPVLSPGMKHRHYAPKAKIRLVYAKEELNGPYMVPTQKNLYHDLRNADRNGVTEIQIFMTQAVQEDPALMNRLLRAAGKIV